METDALTGTVGQYSQCPAKRRAETLSWGGGHLAKTRGLREGFQRRFLLKPEGASQGKDEVKVEENGALGRRNGKTAWHF